MSKRSKASQEEVIEQAIKQLEFGQYITKLRSEKDLTIKRVAEELGISANYLSELERGKKMASDHLIRDIAKFLGKDENELFTVAGKTPLMAQEAMEQYPELGKTIAEIKADSRLTEDQKQNLFDQITNLYKRTIEEIEGT